VFPLFLLSTPVVDSRTIRGTSGKHRASFNWANFLSRNSRKNYGLRLLLPPATARPPSRVHRFPGISGAARARMDIREVSLNSNETSRTRSILDSVQGPPHNSPPTRATLTREPCPRGSLFHVHLELSYDKV
jgi:hypothetical protein